MEMIRSRNAQQAVAAMLHVLYTEGDQQDDGLLELTSPTCFTFEKPRERLIFWPGIRRNVAGELAQALSAIQTTEEHIESAAEAVKAGNENFLFSNPRLMVQCRMNDLTGAMDLYAIVADPNPFTGAFGQLGLQLSILLELLAKAGKAKMGEMTVQHQVVRLPGSIVGRMMREGLDELPDDPYQKGMKARPIDGPLGLGDLLKSPEETMGHKSKWIRHVAGPTLVAGREEDPEKALELAKKIKGDDWRRSMVEWCEAVAAHQAAADAEASE